MTRALADQFAAHAKHIGILHSCYVVGGAVRDLLMGRESPDFDIVIPADAPEATAQGFAAAIDGRIVLLDEQFGIMRIAKDGRFIDLCAQHGATIEEDLRNRDLTINAMAQPLAARAHADGMTQIIDPCNGRTDLAAKMIRMVSETNFRKDPLRMLRAYRFALDLGFSIELQTVETIRTHRQLIETVAVERTADELRRILLTRSSYPVVKLMMRDGLLDHIVPELGELERVQRQKHLQSYGYLEHLLNSPQLFFFEHAGAVEAYFRDRTKMIALKLAALLPSLRSTLNAAGRLRLSGAEQNAIALIARNIDRFGEAIGSDKNERLLLLHELGDTLYALVMYLIYQECICQMADSPTIYYCREMLDLYHGDYKARAALLPLVTGNELMEALGIPPSPRVGEMLNRIQYLTLSGIFTTKDDALAAARIWLT